MTSDRGTSGGAELHLDTPEEEEQIPEEDYEVQPKSPGLNPNATVFLSSKAATTGPTDTGQWEPTAGMPLVNANDYLYTNGDIGSDKSDQGGVFSPTADSPGFQGTELPSFIDTQTSTFQNDNGLPVDDVQVPPVPDGEVPVEGQVSEEQLRQMLKTQLEMYFSRDNLMSDRYLQSQMDADQYVPITTVANLSQIQCLTNDIELIVHILRESQQVQVDEKGERVRPNHNRCIVILREIPDTTPVEEVQELFSGEGCPKFVSCEFAANNSWYVTFDSDASAQKAYQYLREDVKTFLGKPIMARIKAKPLIRRSYAPRNGYIKHLQEQQQQQQQQQQQVVADQQQIPAQTQQYPITQPFTLMPNVSQYLGGQQILNFSKSGQTNSSNTTSHSQFLNPQQAIPFYPPPNPLLQTWTAAPSMLEPSMVLAMNGYQATNIKLNTPGNRNVFQSTMNRNNRNQKLHRPPTSDRITTSEPRINSFDRERERDRDRDRDRDRPPSNSSTSSHKTSPRNMDTSSSISNHSSYHSRRGDNSIGNNNHSHMVHSTLSQQTSNMESNSTAMGSRQSSTESAPPPQRSYRSRRLRKEEDGARLSRHNSSQSTGGRDGRHSVDPQFDYEPTSFPPLPGSSNNTTSGEVFESKLSDVVKGTARPQVREPVTKPAATSATTSTTSISAPVTSPNTATATTTTTTNTSHSSSSRDSGISSASSGSSPTPMGPSSPSITSPQPVSPIQRSVTKPSHSAPPESKTSEKQSQPVSKPPAPPTSQAKVMEDKQPVRLSYAQMVQRGKDVTPDNTADKCDNDGATDNDCDVEKANHTLKEQSQSQNLRSTPAANSRPAYKDSIRKDYGGRDFEPKEQRFTNGRRLKENRERRGIRRDRERDGPRSSTSK